MVSKVTSMTPGQIYTKFNELPKEYKVAIGVLTLAATYIVVSRLIRLCQWAWSSGSVDQPKLTMVRELFDTDEQYTSIPVIPDDVVVKSAIDPARKDQIYYDILARTNAFSASGKFLPICKGYDSLDKPFYFFSFKKVDGGAICGIILSSAQVAGKRQSFYEKVGDFEVGKDLPGFLKGLIKGTNAQYKLIESSETGKKEITIKRDKFPFEILNAFGDKLKKTFLPVFYKSEEMRIDAVDQKAKLAAIVDQCEASDDNESSINIGLDAWGMPFIELICVSKNEDDEDKDLVYYIYGVGNDWYINDKKSSSEEATPLEHIIKGSHHKWKLAD